MKELYYYLDNLPDHSYMRALYKYPQSAFPYQWLREENKKRTFHDREFELTDTGRSCQSVTFAFAISLKPQLLCPGDNNALCTNTCVCADPQCKYLMK